MRDAAEPKTTQDARGELVTIGLMAETGELIGEVLVNALPMELLGNHPLLALVALGVDGPLRPAQLAERTRLSRSGTTKVLDRLEKHGLIIRSYGAVREDRRGTTVALSPAGEQAVISMATTLRSHEELLGRLAASLAAYLEQRHGS